MREFLEDLARALVDAPDQVKVESFEEDDGTLVLELSVAEDDYGQIIGRGGRTPQGRGTGLQGGARTGTRPVLARTVGQHRRARASRRLRGGEPPGSRP